MNKCDKSDVFSVGYGRIWEIAHALVVVAALESKGLGGTFSRISKNRTETCP